MHQPEVLPEAPDDGLLVKTLYAGICHVELGSSGVAGNPAHVEGMLGQMLKQLKRIPVASAYYDVRGQAK